MTVTFEIYRTRKGEWRWKLRAKNGKLIANAGESYRNRADMMRAIDLVRATDLATPIETSPTTSSTGISANASRANR